MEVYVDISKKLIRILCLIKNNKSFLKNKNFKKLKKKEETTPWPVWGWAKRPLRPLGSPFGLGVGRTHRPLQGQRGKT